MTSIFLLFVVALVVARGRPDVYTSTAYLLRIWEAEREVVQEMKKFISSSKTQPVIVRRYIDDFERMLSDHDVSSDSEAPVSDPLRVFQLIKMLVEDWTSVDQVLRDPDWADVYHAVSEHRQGLAMPQFKDLQGAAAALFLLQDTYDLPVSSMARGEILGLRSPVRLTSKDCRFLGKNAFHARYFNLAIAWYEHARLLSRQEDIPTVEDDEIKLFLQQAMTAITSGKGHHPSRYNESNMADLRSFYFGRYLNYEEVQRNYKALCNGQKIRSLKVESNLKCHLAHRNKPYFILQPVKLEAHSYHPPLYTFYDVISDSEIELLKKLAHPKLGPSTVVSLDGVTLETSEIRTSQNAWLHGRSQVKETKATLDRITTRIGLLTGLQTLGNDSAEGLQVANYGIGGHYIPHHDCIFNGKTAQQRARIPRSELAKGDRIATLMFYLSDVARGGATVFPRIGAAVWPVKGSAAFWYNLQLRGEIEPWTLHAACPVVHGSKWVATKWIRERSQLFTRPCSLWEDV